MTDAEFLQLAHDALAEYNATTDFSKQAECIEEFSRRVSTIDDAPQALWPVRDDGGPRQIERVASGSVRARGFDSLEKALAARFGSIKQLIPKLLALDDPRTPVLIDVAKILKP